MRLNQDSLAPAPEAPPEVLPVPAAASEAVLWKRRVAGRRREEVKKWLAVRNAGREARNIGVGVMVREERSGRSGWTRVRDDDGNANWPSGCTP